VNSVEGKTAFTFTDVCHTVPNFSWRGVLKEINQQGTTILLVEQNARIPLKYAHRGYVLETGNIVLEGSGQDLRQNEKIKKAYLGE
jgi:ABC-type branched-subunit amino acid transport system ATPase component